MATVLSIHNQEYSIYFLLLNKNKYSSFEVKVDNRVDSIPLVLQFICEIDRSGLTVDVSQVSNSGRNFQLRLQEAMLVLTPVINISENLATIGSIIRS